MFGLAGAQGAPWPPVRQRRRPLRSAAGAKTGSGHAQRWHAGCRCVRLHHRGRGQCGVRAGEPPDRVGPSSRAAAGSRAGGPQSLDPYSARLRQAVQRRQAQLDVQHGAGGGAGRTPHPAAPGQGAGRLQQHQWLAVCPRPGGGFRHLATAGQPRLGLPRPAAAVPPRGGPAAWRGRVARRGRSAGRVRPEGGGPAVRRVHPGRRAGGLAPQRRFQRRVARRRRLLPGHRPERPAHQHRGRLSSRRPWPHQPARADRGGGVAHPVRWAPCPRHFVSARRQGVGGAGRAGGDPVRGRLRLAPAAASVWGGAGGMAAIPAGGGRAVGLAGSRPRPAGPCPSPGRRIAARSASR